MREKISTQLHLENLVAALVANHPLPEKPLRPGETEKREAALKMPCLVLEPTMSDLI